MTEPTFPAAKSGAELRRRLLHEYQLESAGQLVLVDSACAALDLALTAERLLKKEGVTVQGARGLIANPAAAVAQQARSRLMRAIRMLDLED